MEIILSKIGNGMNRETGSPQLRPYYDDGQHSGEELEPFNFDDDTNYNTQGDFAPIEDEYDAVNDDTFGCAEPIGNTEGLDTLAERVCFKSNITSFSLIFRRSFWIWEISEKKRILPGPIRQTFHFHPHSKIPHRNLRLGSRAPI